MEDGWTQFIKESASADTSAMIRNITCGRYHNILFLVGAGISVAAGFPTFRSDQDLSAVLDKDQPSHEIFKALRAFTIEAEPTDFHMFMDSVASRIYTQNIDGLERDDDRVVFTHGRLTDGARCTSEKCGYVMPWAEFRQQLHYIYISCPQCKSDLRPNITLYGEEVQFDYQHAVADIGLADLLICAGTSLQVYPFADLLKVSCNKLIIEPQVTHHHTQHLAGGISSTYLYQGDCQEFARACRPC